MPLCHTSCLSPSVLLAARSDYYYGYYYRGARSGSIRHSWPRAPGAFRRPTWQAPLKHL